MPNKIRTHALTCIWETCGKEFESRNKNKRYCCPTCQARANNKRLWERLQAKGHTQWPVRKCKRPGLRSGLSPEDFAIRQKARQKEYKRRYGQKMKDERKSWERRLIAKYGVTAYDYAHMLNAQDRKCKLCGLPETEVWNSVLHVDHCHSRNQVRALLCFHCNALLGQAKDRIDVLQRAIAYLEGTNGIPSR